MIGLRRALIALGVLGAALAALGVLVVMTSDHLELRGLDAAVGALLMGTFIGTGLFAWSRRPGNRVGPLMTATGFAAFVPMLSASDAPVVFTLGVAFGNVYVALAVHMLLAFPTGRVETRGQRRLLAATYGLTLGVPVAFVLFSPDCGCPDAELHPDNAFLIADAPTVAAAIEAVGSVVALGIVAGIATVLLRRWRAAGPRDRSALSPVLLTGSLMVVLLAAMFALDIAIDGGRAAQIALWAALTAFAALPFAFLAGLVRSRAWRTGAVAELVDALGDAPARGELRDALAEALGDPTLELAYWLPDRERYVDEQGHPLTLPGDDDPRRAATDVEREDRCVGALVHDRALCGEQELLRTVAAAAALALDNERLDAELRARVEELQASRQRILEAGMAERRRLERDLHDGAQQRLVSLSLQLGLVDAQLERDPAAARELLGSAREEVRAALEELRELARGIHPAVLTDRGLGPAVEALAARAPLPVEVAEVPADRLPSAVEAAAYFVVAESLTNVAKYAQASYAEVRIARENGAAVVEVRDDGAGGADPAAGSGLRGLADRLAALDGRLRIDSSPGQGTTVRAEVPCASC